MPCFKLDDEKRDLGTLDKGLKHLYLLMKKTGHVPSKAPGTKCQFDKQTRDLAALEKCDLDQWHTYNEKYGSTKLVLDYFATQLGLKSYVEVDAANLNEDLVFKKLLQFVIKHEFFPKPQGEHDKGWMTPLLTDAIEDTASVPLPNVCKFHFGKDLGKKRVLARAAEAKQAMSLNQKLQAPNPIPAAASGGWDQPADPNAPRFSVGDTVLRRLDLPKHEAYELAVVEEVIIKHKRKGVEHGYALRNSRGNLDPFVAPNCIHNLMDLHAKASQLSDSWQAPALTQGATN